MGPASAILGLASMLFMVGGAVTTLVPVVGSLLSFGAPVVALFGLVLGGVAISRAQRHGEPSTFATVGLVLNAIGFLMGLVFAMTCGLCNACLSQAQTDPHAHWQLGPTPGSAWSQGSQGSHGCPTPPCGPAPSPLVSPTPAPTAPTMPGFAPPPVPSSAPDDLPPACERARACCEAYFDDPGPCEESLRSAQSAGDVEQACDELARAYRGALASVGRELPAACGS
ncbi:MAG: hypothetical protein KF901_31115 [Myxococcales bacterium]|nr:hypothetical protein [Myxococcales bacterium]